MTAAAAAALAAAVVWVTQAHAGPVRDADLWLLHAAVSAKAHGFAWLVDGAASLGDAPVVGVALLCVAVLGARRCGVAAAAGAVAAVAAAVVLTRLLEPLAAHPNPASRVTDLSIGSDSWPSGHAAVTAALALVAWRLLGRPGGWRAAALAAYPLVVGWGKVASNSHFPSDVLGGWAIAVACCVLSPGCGATSNSGATTTTRSPPASAR